MKHKKYSLIVIALIIIFLIACTINLSWGTYSISFERIWQTLLGNGTNLERITIFSLRLPRLLIACVVGAALSIAGLLMQTTLKNDLVDASILGTSSGASLFAVIYITSFTTNYYDQLGDLAIFTMPFIAIIGSLLISSFVLFSSIKNGEVKSKRLILTGLGVQIAITAIIMFYQLSVSSGLFNRVLTWTNGSLWGSNYKYLLAVLPIVLLLILYVCFNYKTLDILSLGDETAVGLGVNVRRKRIQLFYVAVLLAGSVTAIAGSIGFVGLVAPQIAKQLSGTKHKKVIPTTILISMALLVLSDSIARNIFSPIEIPVGIIISLVGVPYFIYLLLRKVK